MDELEGVGTIIKSKTSPTRQIKRIDVVKKKLERRSHA